MVFIIQPQFPLSTALKFSSSPLKGGNCIFEDISGIYFRHWLLMFRKKDASTNLLLPPVLH